MICMTTGTSKMDTPTYHIRYVCGPVTEPFWRRWLAARLREVAGWLDPVPFNFAAYYTPEKDTPTLLPGEHEEPS
jgi:hypothetical protein